jgi:hypothetical protein
MTIHEALEHVRQARMWAEQLEAVAAMAQYETELTLLAALLDEGEDDDFHAVREEVNLEALTLSPAGRSEAWAWAAYSLDGAADHAKELIQWMEKAGPGLKLLAERKGPLDPK